MSDTRLARGQGTRSPLSNQGGQGSGRCACTFGAWCAITIVHVCHAARFREKNAVWYMVQMYVYGARRKMGKDVTYERPAHTPVSTARDSGNGMPKPECFFTALNKSPSANSSCTLATRVVVGGVAGWSELGLTSSSPKAAVTFLCRSWREASISAFETMMRHHYSARQHSFRNRR